MDLNQMMGMKIGLEDLALMPNDDWDDHNQWEIYYRKIKPKLKIPFNSIQDSSWRFLELAKSIRFSIWFPRCGFDYAPILYNTVGFKVYATDISETAISFQKDLKKNHQKSFTVTGKVLKVKQD